jgi:ATP-dependent protease ClpP protease subunit
MEKIKPNIVNNSKDGFTEIKLSGDIGRFDAYYISEQINKCETKKIRMSINSFGGNVLDAFEIVSAMVNFMNAGGIIETINCGRADSCAGWISACGSRGYRKVMQFAGGFFHAPMFEDGTTLDMLSESDPKKALLNEYFDRLINIFVNATGRTYNAVKTIMSNNTDMDSKQLVKEGFADEVLNVDNIPKLKNELSREQIVNFYDAAQYNVITNNSNSNQINSNSNSNMKKIASLLNLNPEASESAIEGEISKALSELKDLKNTASAKEAEIVTLKAEKSALQSEVANLKDAEVIAFVESLEIKDENEKAGALRLAKVDFTAFKNLNVVKNKKGAIIDKDIEPSGDAVEAEKTDAKTFKNMSLADRSKLKNDNYSQYSKLAAAYDKLGGEI